MFWMQRNKTEVFDSRFETDEIKGVSELTKMEKFSAFIPDVYCFKTAFKNSPLNVVLFLKKILCCCLVLIFLTACNKKAPKVVFYPVKRTEATTETTAQTFEQTEDAQIETSDEIEEVAADTDEAGEVEEIEEHIETIIYVDSATGQETAGTSSIDTVITAADPPKAIVTNANTAGVYAKAAKVFESPGSAKAANNNPKANNSSQANSSPQVNNTPQANNTPQVNDALQDNYGPQEDYDIQDDYSPQDTKSIENIINSKRNSSGVGSLATDPALSRTAQGYSNKFAQDRSVYNINGHAVKMSGKISSIDDFNTKSFNKGLSRSGFLGNDISKVGVGISESDNGGYYYVILAK